MFCFIAAFILFYFILLHMKPRLNIGSVSSDARYREMSDDNNYTVTKYGDTGKSRYLLVDVKSGFRFVCYCINKI